jgi:hypothetical protein
MARGATTALQLTSTLATGTSPFAVTSTTVNTNLNADLWDSNHYPLTTLGDIMYGANPTGQATRLAGNSTTVKQYLSSTGTGGGPFDHNGFILLVQGVSI